MTECKEIFDFGCVPHCGHLAIPIRPLKDGNYHLVYYFDGVYHKVSTVGKAGYYIVFTDNPLPINKTVLFSIQDDYGKKLFYSFLKDELKASYENYCDMDCVEDCIVNFMIRTVIVFNKEDCKCADEFYDPCVDCEDC